MILTDFLDHIVAIFLARFPNLASCATHPGTFDSDELRQFATLTPAIRVACLGMGESQVMASDERQSTLQLGAFIITSDRAGLPRDQASLNLVESLAIELPLTRWGLPHVYPAEAVRARNLYGGKLGVTGASLWAVSWEQRILLGTDIWDTEGVLPTELYASWAPDIGEEHEADYLRIEELPDVP